MFYCSFSCVCTALFVRVYLIRPELVRLVFRGIFFYSWAFVCSCLLGISFVLGCFLGPVSVCYTLALSFYFCLFVTVYHVIVSLDSAWFCVFVVLFRVPTPCVWGFCVSCSGVVSREVFVSINPELVGFPCSEFLGSSSALNRFSAGCSDLWSR